MTSFKFKSFPSKGPAPSTSRCYAQLPVRFRTMHDFRRSASACRMADVSPMFHRITLTG